MLYLSIIVGGSNSFKSILFSLNAFFQSKENSLFTISSSFMKRLKSKVSKVEMIARRGRKASDLVRLHSS